MLKDKVILLRKQGKTYTEIREILDKRIPKSTISYWCKNVILSEVGRKRIDGIIAKNTKQARKKALAVKKIEREKYLKSVESRVKHLGKLIKNESIAKIALAMLYLGEGSKATEGALMFGNSNPEVIALFLGLLRLSYDIDEKKFRCTLQCRADQDIKVLESFWAKITGILPSQFYKAQIDPRTIGKPSKKIDYKGVCRIDYFSADLFNELTKISEVVIKKFK